MDEKARNVNEVLNERSDREDFEGHMKEMRDSFFLISPILWD